MVVKRKVSKFDPDRLMRKHDVVILKAETVCTKPGTLARMLREAYAQGRDDQVRETGQGRTYTAQRQYADRYAAVRDLLAHGVRRRPLIMSGNEVQMLQGELLDQFLDRAIDAYRTEPRLTKPSSVTDD